MSDTLTMNDFERFSPTQEQVDFAAQYATDNGLDSVFVGVDFPGKRYGMWMFGQERKPVMDGDQPVIWTERIDALVALETKAYGNVFFRVFSDGVVGAATEYI